MFGWPSLSGMLKELGNFAGGCDQPEGGASHKRHALGMVCQGPPPSCFFSPRLAAHITVHAPPAGQVCTSQESSLALLWTLGIFTLNCGPVLMGFVLDFLGPKLTGILGGLVGLPQGRRRRKDCRMPSAAV